MGRESALIMQLAFDRLLFEYCNIPGHPLEVLVGGVVGG